MQPIKLFTLIAATSVLGACAMSTAENGPRDWDVAEVRALPQQGDQFNQALHNDYVTLAQTEHDEGHWEALSYYNIKARQAASGANVQPTMMVDRGHPKGSVDELTKSRAALVHMLNAGGRGKAPVMAAKAQSQYDCWAEELEENMQPKDIALCRAGFMAAMDQANSKLFASAKPMQQSSSPDIAAYTINFDHNSMVLNNKANTTNNEVIALVKATGAKTVRVSGYADTSGDHEYNRQLAESRARVVSNAIERGGIKPIIDTVSFGEDSLAVETGNNVRERQNRRVVIRVQ